MVRLCCSVPLCKNISDRVVRRLSWHSFPIESELRKKWVIAIRRDLGKNFNITRHSKVCSEHFLKKDFKPLLHSKKRYLKQGVVPSVFQFSKKESEVHKKGRQQRDDRASKRRKQLSQSELPNTEPQDTCNLVSQDASETNKTQKSLKLKRTTRKRLSKRSVSEELCPPTAQKSDAGLSPQIKGTTSTSLVPIPISRPLVTTAAINKVAIKNAQVTKVLPKDSLPGRLVIGNSKVNKMPDPHALLRLLKLPPNVMFNINATSTKVYNRVPKEMATSSTVPMAKNNEVHRTTSQIANKVFALEHVSKTNQINSEKKHDSDAVHIHQEMKVLDLESCSQPIVEMTFECDEPVVKDIKTEPPDSKII